MWVRQLLKQIFIIIIIIFIIIIIIIKSPLYIKL